MTEARIQLSNGVLFDLLEPDPELIEIETIAHSLSQLCRFTGHTADFYSVAQHCVVVSRLVPLPEFALHGLLHDASEAFVGDVSSPLKRLLPEYQSIEGGVELAIMDRFSVDLDYERVKHADRVAMATERRDLGVTGNDEFWNEHWPLPEPAPWTIVPLEIAEARVAFLARFAEIVLRPGQGQAPIDALLSRPKVVEGYTQAEPLDPNRFETNKDRSERLAREEEDGTDGEWSVVG